MIVFNLKQQGVWRACLEEKSPVCPRCKKEYLLNSIHCTVRFFLPDLWISCLLNKTAYWPSSVTLPTLHTDVRSWDCRGTEYQMPKMCGGKHLMPGNMIGQTKDCIVLCLPPPTLLVLEFWLSFQRQSRPELWQNPQSMTLLWTTVLLSAGVERGTSWGRICYLAFLLM